MVKINLLPYLENYTRNGLLICLIKPAHNSTYPKGGVSCSKDIPIAIGIVVNQTLVFQIKFCGKSPALRVAAKRYAQCYNNQCATN